MLEQLAKDRRKYKMYVQAFIARNACSSVSIESHQESDYVFKEATTVSNWMQAYNYLFDKNNVLEFRDTVYQLEKLVSKITGGLYEQYRTTYVVVNGSNVERSRPDRIRSDIYSLYNKYINLWSGIEDPFLREAYFHIEFLHIHPFEDGNGRVARLLTIYNFWNQGIAPPVLPVNLKREYCDYIENQDYEGLAKMMRKLSKREEIVIRDTIGVSKTKR